MSLLSNPVIQSILSKYRAATSSLGGSGLSYVAMGEAFAKLITNMVAELVAELDSDPNTKGADKKALVIEAAGELFDSLSGSLVGLPWYLAPLWPIVAPMVRGYAVNFAGGLVEWALGLIRGNQLAVKPV